MISRVLVGRVPELLATTAARVAGLEGWIMGMILTFVARSRQAAGTSATVKDAHAPCQILLFTGVRYERWIDAAEKSAPQKKRPRRRKKAPRKLA